MSKLLVKINMPRKRNNIEITVDILKIAKNGAKKMHIVYQANLNSKVLHEYLAELERTDLITNPAGRGGIIRTTEKGLEYLECYDRLKKYMAPS